jgi:hypothetical protein
MKGYKRLHTLQLDFKEIRPGGVKYILRKRVSVVRLANSVMNPSYAVVSEVSNINVARQMKSHWYSCEDDVVWCTERRQAKKLMHTQMKLLAAETREDLIRTHTALN